MGFGGNATNQQLTIPVILAGNTQYTNVVVQIDSVVRVSGGAAKGSYDVYDGTTNKLTIPSLVVGNTTYTNVVAKVKSIVSPGSAGSKYDTYDLSTNQLLSPSVVAGSTTYTNVLTTVQAVASMGGGTPNGSQDTYNASINQLTIPLVVAGDTAYTNVAVTVGSVLGIGGQSNTGGVSTAALSKLCPTVLGYGAYGNCKGTGDSTTADVLLPVSQKFQALTGVSGAINISTRSDMPVGAACSFGIEPFIPLFASVVNGVQKTLSFTGAVDDQIALDTSGTIVQIMVGDKTKGPSFEINRVVPGVKLMIIGYF